MKQHDGFLFPPFLSSYLKKAVRLNTALASALAVNISIKGLFCFNIQYSPETTALNMYALVVV